MELNPTSVEGLHDRLLRHRRPRRVRLRATSPPLRRQRLWARSEARAKGYLGKTPFGKDWALTSSSTPALARTSVARRRRSSTARGQARRARLKPPSAQAGAFGCPTTVNNLETIAAVPTAFKLGCEEFSKLSAIHHLNDGGVRLFGVNGHVKKPGVQCCGRRSTLRELIYDPAAASSATSRLADHPRRVVDAPPRRRQGPRARREVALPRVARSVRPDVHSASTPSATSARCSAPAARRSWRGHRPGVLLPQPDAVLPPRVVRSVHAVPRRLRLALPHRGEAARRHALDGRAQHAPRRDANNVMGNTICAFGEGMAMPALGFPSKFRKEFEAHVRRRPEAATSCRRRLVTGNGPGR